MGGALSGKVDKVDNTSNDNQKLIPTRPRSDSETSLGAGDTDTIAFTAALAQVRDTVGFSFSAEDCRGALEDSLGNPEMAVMLLLEAHQRRPSITTYTAEDDTALGQALDDIFSQPDSDDDEFAGLFDEDDDDDTAGEQKCGALSSGERKEPGAAGATTDNRPLPGPQGTFIHYDFQALQASTKEWNLTHLIGQGSFGTVFRGRVAGIGKGHYY